MTKTHTMLKHKWQNAQFLNTNEAQFLNANDKTHKFKMQMTKRTIFKRKWQDIQILKHNWQKLKI